MKKNIKKTTLLSTYLVCAFILNVTIACQTSQRTSTDLEDKNQKTAVKPGLNSKIDLSKTINNSHLSKLLITKDLLPFFTISRKKTELRKGPGLSFAIKDTFLEENDRVLILDKFNIWRKVYAPEHNQWGWLHYRTIAEIKKPKETFNISVEAFPLVFTKHNGVKVYDFRTKNPLNQKLPKGYAFYALNKTDTMILVYIPTTKTVAWMQRGDVI